MSGMLPSRLAQLALASARRGATIASQNGLLASLQHQQVQQTSPLNTAPFYAQPSMIARELHSSSSCASSSSSPPHRGEYHATTILCIRKDGQVAMVGDGQVSMGSMVAKPNAKKIRRIGETVIAGFAGSAADGLSLLERLEAKLEEHPDQLMRSAVELAKLWRQDKALRFLQAEILVADKNTTLVVSGNGDVLEPHDGVMGIGSGSPYATAASRALMDVPGMDAKAIAMKAMHIAADMCVYTNSNFVVETIDGAQPDAKTKDSSSVLAPDVDLNPISKADS